MSALDIILNKGVDETTSLEHAVQILFLNDQTEGKPFANEAAEELADYKLRIDLLAKGATWEHEENERLKETIEQLRADLAAAVEALEKVRDLDNLRLSTGELAMYEYIRKEVDSILARLEGGEEPKGYQCKS